MFNIKFLNENFLRQVGIKKIKDHVIEITGCSQNLSGFQLLKENGSVLGKYEDYTTLYRELKNGFQLSNNNSVYIESEQKTYHPTLDELKQQKTLEVKSACKEIIYAGVDVEIESGEVEHFSLKEEDQINLFAKQAQISWGITELEYHQDGYPCRYYTLEEMTKIIESSIKFVSYHTTYCNSLYTWINSVTSAEDLSNIYYGVEIPDQYQSEVLKSYLSKIGGVY